MKSNEFSIANFRIVHRDRFQLQPFRLHMQDKWRRNNLCTGCGAGNRCTIAIFRFFHTVVVSVQLPLRVCNFSRKKQHAYLNLRDATVPRAKNAGESIFHSKKLSNDKRSFACVKSCTDCGLITAAYAPWAEVRQRGNMKAWIDCTKFWIVEFTAQVHSSTSTHWVRGSTLFCVVVSSPRCHRHLLLLLLYRRSSMTHSIHECNRKLR